VWGATGWTRLFNAENGGQVSWLIPAALVLLGAGLVLAGRAARTDRGRAGFVLWGGWLLVTMATFSFMAGIFHPYYNVALAPAIGALVGMGVTVLWRRHDRVAMLTLAGVIAVTAVWASVLLGRNVGWQTWLTPTILTVGLGAAVILALAQLVRSGLLPRLATAAVVAAGIGAGLAGPAAYALDTVVTDHGGAIPSAGPVAAGARGGPGGRGPGGLAGRPDRGRSGPAAGALPGAAGGGQRPDGTVRGPGQVPGGQLPGGPAQGGPFAGGPVAGGRGGPGGLLNAGTPSAEMIAALRQDAGAYTWAAATIGANNAAGYQLASGEAIMPIGGFNGSDPSPTLEQFQQYVAEHRIHYFIGGGIGGGGFNANGGSRTAQQIAAWVTANFRSTTVGGVTVYDLS
jgi:4-amino-4-deoxy-L-arabinose transferase-like glycosyltransferase